MTEAALAGYDGFDVTSEKNYFDEKMMSVDDAEKHVLMNRAIREYLAKLRSSMKISFITPSLYEEETPDE